MAGFVTKPKDWKYSSARNFCGMKGLFAPSYFSFLWHMRVACANAEDTRQGRELIIKNEITRYFVVGHVTNNGMSVQ
jgi:hypothetical protein